jgi:penicillin-binding protein 2
MIQNPDDRRPPLTPQLALRVAVIGGFALTLFAIIFFRLWFLQVLDGQQYANAASLNTLRTVAIPAPRGEILDSNGATLVSSTQALDVQIQPPDMPVPVTTANMYPPHVPHADNVVYRRLAGVLRISDKPPARL